MAPLDVTRSKEVDSVHETETKTVRDSTLQIYLEFAGKDDQWKAIHNQEAPQEG